MYQSKVMAKRARIRLAGRRGSGRMRLVDRRVRFAVRLPGLACGPSMRPQTLIHQLSSASNSLHEALYELDYLLIRDAVIREDCRSEVHEAIGLIVESLGLLSKAHDGLKGASEPTWTGAFCARPFRPTGRM